MKQLYDEIINSIMDTNSVSWVEEKIPAVIDDWKNTMKNLAVA